MTSCNCLLCDEVLAIKADSLLGEIVQCPSCGQQHEILDNTSSLKLGFAPEIEEDWGE